MTINTGTNKIFIKNNNKLNRPNINLQKISRLKYKQHKQ